MSSAAATPTPEDISYLQSKFPRYSSALNARRAWLDTAHDKQLTPAGLDWDTFLLLGGRGSGKSRSVVEAAWWEGFLLSRIRIHALGPTVGDVRGTLFEGDSGFLSCIPPELVASYNPSVPGGARLTMTNGTTIRGFSMTDEGDRLRGPQCHLLVGDEICAADKPAGNLEDSYKVAVLGCRLPRSDGKPARKLLATTPKPIPFLKNLIRRPGVITRTIPTYENLKNLSASFRNELLAIEGTAYARQELHGEILEDNTLSIFKRSWFRLWPHIDAKTGKPKKLPEFDYIVMSMDTAMSDENYDAKRQEADYSAAGVFGVFNVAQCFTEAERKKLNVKSKYAALLCDFWMERLGFPELLEKTRATYRTKWGSPGRRPDVVLIEAKQSGISLRQTLIQYGIATLPYNPHSQSKTMRAHAASPLLLQGMLFVPETAREGRAGEFRDWACPLVDQMCGFCGEGSIPHDDGLDACLGAGTMVVTDKGLVAVEHVVPGTKVLTHKGRFRPVTAVSSRLAPATCKLKAKGLDEITLTPDHRVLAASVQAPPNSSKFVASIGWMDAGLIIPRGYYGYARDRQLVKSKTRQPHHALVLPRIKPNGCKSIDLARYWAASEVTLTDSTIKSRRPRSRMSPRYIALDYESGWVMGLFAAEGCVVRPKSRNGMAAQIRWACDKYAVTRVRSWCAVNLNRDGKVRRVHGAHAFSAGCTVAAPLFEEFGYLAPNKIIPPFVLQGPDDFVAGFLEGLMYGDGHVSKRQGRQKETQTTLCSTSLHLIWGTKLLLARTGRFSSTFLTKAAGKRPIFGRICDCQQAYGLGHANGQHDWTAVNTDDYQALYVEYLRFDASSAIVYDVSVEEDESLVTTGGTVHNCVQAMLTLMERGTFHAVPQGRDLPDPDEKAEQEQRAAMIQYEREKRGRFSPYGS